MEIDSNVLFVKFIMENKFKFYILLLFCSLVFKKEVITHAGRSRGA